MCLAIYRPEGKTIKKDWLKSGWDSNSDGAGFSTIEGNKLIINKGFFKFKDFYKAYRKHHGKPMLIHFRWKTSGKLDENNCHPWPIPHKTTESLQYAVIHNGVIDIDTKSDLTMSDTGHYVNHVLRPILHEYPGAWRSKAFKYLVEQGIGSSNKIAIMCRSGHVSIYNEDAGVWDEGCWYSNTTYATRKYRTYTTGHNYHSPYTRNSYQGRQIGFNHMGDGWPDYGTGIEDSMTEDELAEHYAKQFEHSKERENGRYKGELESEEFISKKTYRLVKGVWCLVDEETDNNTKDIEV